MTDENGLSLDTSTFTQNTVSTNGYELVIDSSDTSTVGSMNLKVSFTYLDYALSSGGSKLFSIDIQNPCATGLSASAHSNLSSELVDRSYVIGSGFLSIIFSAYTPSIANCPITYSLNVDPAVPAGE